MLHWTQLLEGEGKEGGRAKGDRYRAAVAHGRKVYLFESYADFKRRGRIFVCVFDTLSSHWSEPPRRQSCHELPSKRWGHTAAVVGDTAFIWGGYWCGRYYDALYAYDLHLHRWSKPRHTGTVPQGRGRHLAFVLEKIMFIFGGHTTTEYTNDLYRLDTGTMVWSLVDSRGTPPYFTESNSAAIVGTKMFVFKIFRNDVSVFDTDTNLWLNTSTAQFQFLPRQPSIFTYNGELYALRCRSLNLDPTFIDLWKFSPGTVSWKMVEPKSLVTVLGTGIPQCAMVDMCCSVVGDRVVVFGGYDDYSNYRLSDDLYILDMSPSLRTLRKLVVIHYGLEKSGLPHNIRWELAAMTT